MPAKKPDPEPPVEDDFYDGEEEGTEEAADFDAPETNAKEKSE